MLREFLLVVEVVPLLDSVVELNSVVLSVLFRDSVLFEKSLEVVPFEDSVIPSVVDLEEDPSSVVVHQSGISSVVDPEDDPASVVVNQSGKSSVVDLDDPSSVVGSKNGGKVGSVDEEF